MAKSIISEEPIVWIKWAGKWHMEHEHLGDVTECGLDVPHAREDIIKRQGLEAGKIPEKSCLRCLTLIYKRYWWDSAAAAILNQKLRIVRH
jgi:hypothetical protein